MHPSRLPVLNVSASVQDKVYQRIRRSRIDNVVISLIELIHKVSYQYIRELLIFAFAKTPPTPLSPAGLSIR